MKTYAHIHDGRVVEIIAPIVDADGSEIEIERRFHSEFVAKLANVTGKSVDVGWHYEGGVFSIPAPTPLTAEEKTRAAELAIQSHLDSAARAKGYENILSASSYAALPAGEPFQAEGAAFATWRARCWAKAYAILADVKAGTRPEPTHDQLLFEMPALVLP